MSPENIYNPGSLRSTILPLDFSVLYLVANEANFARVTYVKELANTMSIKQ